MTTLSSYSLRLHKQTNHTRCLLFVGQQLGLNININMNKSHIAKPFSLGGVYLNPPHIAEPEKPTTMSGALRRSTTLTRLIHKHSLTDPIRPPAAQLQSKAYLRKAKDYDLSPSLFSSAFCSAKSSSATASFPKTGFVGWYLGLVKNRPILTKSVTAALIYTAADLSSQTIAKSDSYDPVRTLRMAGYGMVILGPSMHFWFNFMAKLFPKRDMLSTLKKMAMGQGLYGPTMTVVFFSVNAFLQGENGGEVFDRLKRDLFPTLLRGVMYWPVCDFITFRFIPVHLQTLVSNGFAYLWTVYLTYMASREKAVVVASN